MASADRSQKLKHYFHDVIKGKRNISTPSLAKLFFEAVQAEQPIAVCVETILSSTNGLQAIRTAVRADISTSFILDHSLRFIHVFADGAVKTLANGHFLCSIVQAIAEPPTLWNVLMDMFRRKELGDQQLRAFSWLCSELLDLPVDVSFDIAAHARE